MLLYWMRFLANQQSLLLLPALREREIARRCVGRFYLCLSSILFAMLVSAASSASPKGDAVFLAQKKGSAHLYVTSSVKGARVLVDGIIVGGVNSYIIVSPGVRIIRVFHNAYHPYEHRMNMVAGRSYKMQVQLKKKVTAAEKAAAQQKKQQEKAANQAVPLLAPSAADQAQARPPAYYAPPQAAYPQQVPTQAAQNPYGAPPPAYAPPPQAYAPPRSAKRLKKRQKKKQGRNVAAASTKKSNLPGMFALQPPPRDAADYALSFLPLGLPQMRHDKPALGALMLALQAGGVGAWFYFNSEAEVGEKALVDGEEELKKLRAQNSPNRAKIIARNNLNLENEDYMNQNSDFAMFAMIGGIAGYGFSVLEALVVGPKVKSPADLWSSVDSMPRYSRALQERAAEGMVCPRDVRMQQDMLYDCLLNVGGHLDPAAVRLAFASQNREVRPWDHWNVHLGLFPSTVRGDLWQVRAALTWERAEPTLQW